MRVRKSLVWLSVLTSLVGSSLVMGAEAAPDSPTPSAIPASDLLQVALYNGSQGRISNETFAHYKLDYNSVAATNAMHADTPLFQETATALGLAFSADTTFSAEIVGQINFQNNTYDVTTRQGFSKLFEAAVPPAERTFAELRAMDSDKLVEFFKSEECHYLKEQHKVIAILLKRTPTLTNKALQALLGWNQKFVRQARQTVEKPDWENSVF